MQHQIQWLTTQFPAHRNREFIAALQGIKSGHQGIYLPDQGIPRWPPFHCDVNRLSEHSPLMNRVPEKMSFTHAELEWIAGWVVVVDIGARRTEIEISVPVARTV